MRLVPVLIAVVAAFALPRAAVRAQDALSPAESAAYQMSREFSFLCNPERHRSLTALTRSMVRRDGDSMEGTAALLRTAEGTFLIVEGYDEQLFGHCLVIGWFGGALEPGTYPIGRLAMETLEEELAAERHSFFTMPAVRTDQENSILVTEAGSLEIERTERGGLEGTFEFTGVAVDRGRRGGTATWEGRFSAADVER
jgi:hypothetical protein